jgi:hypothetical protein
VTFEKDPRYLYWTEDVQSPASVPVAGLPRTIATQKNIGFQAQSVFIDNYTTWWLYLKDADIYIPPYWIGVVRNLHHATDWAYAEWRSPFLDLQQPAGISSFFAHFVWTNEILIPAGGNLLQGFSFSTGGVITGQSFVNLPDTSVIQVPIVAPAVALPAIPLVRRRAIMIQAAETNTDYVYIGGPNVTTSRNPAALGGISLAPQQVYPIDTNGAISYAIATVAGQIVIVQEGA